MSTLEILRETIADTLDEEDITTDFIDRKINEGLVRCAYAVRLPELESEGTFTTAEDTHSVPIPTTWLYQRGLYSAESVDIRLIEIASSISDIKSKFDLDSTLRSYISILATSGTKLFYYPIPLEPTEVLCRFYRAPDLLASDTDEATCLPASLRDSLLENYALWKCYKVIEDEMEGMRSNTRHYRKAFLDDLDLLDDHIEEGQSRPEPPRGSKWI